MMIFYGDSMKILVLYPPKKPILACKNPLWDDFKLEDENVQPFLTIEKYFSFKTKIEDDVISSFISNPSFVS